MEDKKNSFKTITWILTDKCDLACKFCFCRKTGTEVDDATLEKGIEYIKEKIKDPNTTFEVQVWGGEILTMDPKKVNYILDRLEQPNVFFTSQSNLMNLNEENLKLIKRLKTLNTSFDYYGRFTTTEQKIKWINNVKYLKSQGVDLLCMFALTKQMIETVNPETVFDFMLALGIKDIELERMIIPLRHIPIMDTMIPDPDVLDEWLFKAYLSYEKYKKDGFRVLSFECLEESLRHVYFYEHGRTCSENNITLDPFGNIFQCYMTRNTPFGTVFDGENDEKFKECLLKEKEIRQECLNCDLFEYCKGDCPHLFWKNGRCSVSKKIYKYLLMKKENT